NVGGFQGSGVAVGERVAVAVAVGFAAPVVDEQPYSAVARVTTSATICAHWRRRVASRPRPCPRRPCPLLPYIPPPSVVPPPVAHAPPAGGIGPSHYYDDRHAAKSTPFVR